MRESQIASWTRRSRARVRLSHDLAGGQRSGRWRRTSQMNGAAISWIAAAQM